MKRIFLTDTEVASILEVSQKTLYRMLKGFHPKRGGVFCSKRVNLVDIAPDSVNGVRRWRISRIASVLGLTPEEIERRIS